MRGIVRFFRDDKGYGFIAPEGKGKDVFVHRKSIVTASLNKLEKGDWVLFEVVQAARGPEAKSVQMTGKSTADERASFMANDPRQRTDRGSSVKTVADQSGVKPKGEQRRQRRNSRDRSRRRLPMLAFGEDY